VGRPRYRMGQSAAAPQLLFMEAAAAEANVEAVGKAHSGASVRASTRSATGFTGRGVQITHSGPRGAP